MQESSVALTFAEVASEAAERPGAAAPPASLQVAAVQRLRLQRPRRWPRMAST